MSGIVPPASVVPKLALEPVRAASDAGLAPADAAGKAATGGPASPPPDESLAALGRLVARLAPLPSAETARGLALERAALTRLAGPGSDAGAAANELRGSLERSGLFYEAHLRAWNAGEFAFEDLKREPQARAGTQIASASQDPLPVPRELERLVREQLATLETRTAVVPLMVWPGQQATLSIADEPPEHAGAASGARAADERTWRAKLQLELPRLGALELALTVHDAQVRVDARAAGAASRAALADRAEDLSDALERNALVLERLEVADDGR
jgi:hypothetical protein